MASALWSVALLLCAAMVEATMRADAFPGWMGETFDPRSETQSEPYERSTLRPGRLRTAKPRGGEQGGGLDRLRGPSPFAMDPTRVTQLSWKPRAFLYKGFLSDYECEYLKQMALPRLEKSMVTDNASGKPVDSTIRTSSGMFITTKNDVLDAIEDRIATWTFLPKENGEAFQVLRYNKGQKYEAHFDYFHDPLNTQLGGHRYATVLMYLSDVEKGGETVFPNSATAGSKDSSWSECGHSGLGVKPKKGDALLFFSLSPNAEPDPASLHTACPVLEGVKWSATKWIHVNSFQFQRQDPSSCKDDDPRCGEWAAAGECRKNPLFMVGDESSLGSCRKSCNSCGKSGSS